jgi:dihydroorotate dehydrogenase (NAD+) catalytic subunit
MSDFLPRYDWRQSYQWNYDQAPRAPVAAPSSPVVALSSPDIDEPPLKGNWTFCGRNIGSPLGVAAGPLLNGHWCLYYAALGFDVVTYKTVRSTYRESYPLPNLQPVDSGPLGGGETNLVAVDDMDGSWAVSFGMPSQTCETWRADVAATRRRLPAHKLLNVSVVGTMRPGWSLEQLADDYAACAHDAAEAGADSIEFNLSCPNVDTCDGQLYQRPSAAAVVAQRVRQAVGSRPLLAKIGHFRDHRDVGPLLESLASHIDAVVATNCIAATVVEREGRPCFNGEPRGIAGGAILDASVRLIETIASTIARRGLGLRAIGVGGISTAADVQRYLNAGAEAVQLATAAMLDPGVGLSIREEMRAAEPLPEATASRRGESVLGESGVL